MVDLILNSKLIDCAHLDEIVTADNIKEYKFVGILFGAGWCYPSIFNFTFNRSYVCTWANWNV